jgi:two-component system nitrate/nitrite response regulator NarL
MHKVRILLADDHTILRDGIRALLEDEPDMLVIGEAEDGRTAVKMACQLKPDLVLMDIAMPLLNGLEATRQIKRECPQVNILILTMHENPHGLTAREREVLQLIAEGYSTRQIAEILSISVKTVQAHRTNLMSKLDLHDRADLIKYAIQRKIIDI